MICPKCGKENPELGKFCNYCGASLEQGKLCSKCGAENPQTSKFCYNCGANLDQTNLCPKCGTEYNKDAKFCRSCGERLRSPEDETKPTANNVETLLSPDEKIIGRFSSIWREYYATNRRLIGFQRPDWVPLLLILGLLPGILAIILTRKEYMGVCEYSKISGVDLVRIREVILGALGIIIGIAFVIWGIFVLATLEDSGGIGLVLLLLGVFAFTVLWFGRPSFYQLRIAGLPKSEQQKWFFSKSKWLKHKNSADKFAELIMTKIEA